MSDGDDEIQRLRAAIDAVDDRLLAELHRRAALVHEVAAWKQARGARVYVPEREREIIERLESTSAGPFPTEAIRPVYSEIISACLSLERPLKVAFLGPEATFTHQAARTRFGLGARFVPSATIAGVCAEVEKGAADLGVVPEESSFEGVVTHSLDLLADRALVIVQEISAHVSQALLARGGALEGIDKVYAHPEALAQCRVWLAANLPRAAAIEVASTALAARLAKDDPLAAALGPELAGALYDLRVVRARVEDQHLAVTRYLVVGAPESAQRRSGADRTTLLLAVDDAPGGLGRALAPLVVEGINLSRIESRPPRRGGTRSWERGYAFIDLEGHVDDPPIARALEVLSGEGVLVRILGSYPRAVETPSP